MEVDNQLEGEVNQDLVEIHEAAPEDLDSYLANKDKFEPEVSAEPIEAKEPQEAQVNAQPEQTPRNDLASVPEKQEVAVNQVKQYTPEEIAAIEAENKRLLTSNEQKERFIQRRNTELGELRKKHDELRLNLLNRKKQLQEGLQEKFDSDPLSAADDRDEIKEINSNLAKIENEGKRAEQIVESQRTFFSHVDTNKVSLDDMAEVLRADGVPEDFIATMKANPWEFANSEALVQIAKRAEERKATVKMSSDLKILANHIKSLNSEISRLKGKPSQMLNNVQRHLNQSPPVTSGNGSSAEDARPMVDPTRMSTEELNNYLRNSH